MTRVLEVLAVLAGGADDAPIRLEVPVSRAGGLYVHLRAHITSDGHVILEVRDALALAEQRLDAILTRVGQGDVVAIADYIAATEAVLETIAPLVESCGCSIDHGVPSYCRAHSILPPEQAQP